MRGALFKALAAALVATSLCGCLYMPPSSDLEIHGKCGKAFSYGGSVVGFPLDAACLPVTAFINEKDPMTGEGVVAWPGEGAEGMFYYLGAGMAYPAYLCALPFSPSMPAGDAARLDWLLAKLPHLDAEEYALLVKLSKREFAPEYETEAYSIRFGWKDTLDMNLAGEWKRWSEDGRPAGGMKERRSIVRYWFWEARRMPAQFHKRALFARKTVCEISLVKPDDVAKYWCDCGNVPKYDYDPVIWRYWIDCHGGIDAFFGLKNQKAEHF